MEDPNYRLLMDYAMRALSRRSHTVHELRVKLKKRTQHQTNNLAFDQNNNNIEKIILRLKELNLLNDDEYIRRAIENATSFKLQGLMKVAQSLHLKGIAIENTKRIWNSMKINEKEVAKLALKKIQKRVSKLPQAKRFNKRAQFLASRGFSVGIVFELAKHE